MSVYQLFIKSPIQILATNQMQLGLSEFEKAPAGLNLSR